MELSVHLFSEHASTRDDLLDPPDDATIRPANKLADLDFDCELAYVHRRSSDLPEWSRYVRPYFDVMWGTRGTTVSAALLPRLGDRFFAVTFGHGRHILNNSLLVPDFGLRVTANSIAPDAVTAMGTSTVGTVSRRTNQIVNMPSTLDAFRLDIGDEWVRSLAGSTDEELAHAMSGSQSLRVRVRDEHAELKRLGELLDYLLRQYESTRYQNTFRFIDALRPLPLHDDRIERLDTILLNRFLDPAKHPTIAVAVPEDRPPEPTFFRLTKGIGHKAREREEIDLAWLHAQKHRVHRPLEQIRIGLVDAEGDRVSAPRPLREYLTTETELDGEMFALAGGRWFRVDATTLAKVERQLDDYVVEYNDPIEPRRIGEHEGPYNDRVAEIAGWINMEHHQKQVSATGATVEMCDLLTEDLHLIFVKSFGDSTRRSHLFSQGSVSARLFAENAELYRENEGYRDFVYRLHAERWPYTVRGNPKIVYAISTERKQPLRELLPLFSRINLANHARTISAFGYQVKLAKIPVVPAIPKARTAGQRGGRRLRDDSRARPQQGQLF
ncbi:uncharacterized protein (TIGR04141 family) [Herbihabitans rhizosphaerae]|uniref:Uncharacterized protein (TIGR04141 family) n=1 Tax=Herbihabitans rhizosphaerae TaxID=1872711 RepID=A0A4V2ESB2_9PSEU|nr:DUF6119 family protein [Herbihabitans rhizosphaerae]RZS36963.1 uncharacterized protein (TIGR04141 family) [Herbihabitans rhizosphaerae]